MQVADDGYMNASDRDRMPSGRQPYDPLVGLRVGALAGGIVGVLVTALMSFSNVWLTLIGAVAGGAVGYLTEKRRVDRGT